MIREVQGSCVFPCNQHRSTQIKTQTLEFGKMMLSTHRNGKDDCIKRLVEDLQLRCAEKNHA